MDLENALNIFVEARDNLNPGPIGNIMIPILFAGAIGAAGLFLARNINLERKLELSEERSARRLRAVAMTREKNLDQSSCDGNRQGRSLLIDSRFFTPTVS
jgi:hypothetical protein